MSLSPFSGLTGSLPDLYRLSNAQTRSICAENPTGAPGKAAMALEGAGASAARDLGLGWKVAPCINIAPKSTVTLAEITGPGCIQHIWNTVAPKYWRSLILRMYWDGEETPSIEVPLGDFFCNGWCERCNVSSLPVAVNPAGGFNCYWPMPFRKSAKITLESLSEEEIRGYYYQITYALAGVPADAAYLHAQFRRSNPLPYKEVHTLIDGVSGQGHYVGTYLAWQANSTGWWGEGEIKFFMDDDTDYPTIAGTGTEDYFGGAWNWEHPQGKYGVYSTPFLGLPQVIGAGEGGMYRSQQRFGMYRWHVMDPIRFQKALRVIIQALGWRSGGRYLPLQDDISSTAFWYQSEPHMAFPGLPNADGLEVI